MEMWNIYLVKRLAEWEGSIAGERKIARRASALMLQAYAIYPGAVEGTKVGLHYRSHSLSSQLCDFALCHSTHLNRTLHPPRLRSTSSYLSVHLIARAHCQPSLPTTSNTDGVTNTHRICSRRRFYQPPSHPPHQPVTTARLPQAHGALTSVAQQCGEQRRRAARLGILLRGCAR